MKITIFLLSATVCLVLGKAKIDPAIFKEVERKDTLTVFVSFKGSNTLGIRRDFSKMKHTLPTRSSKLNTLYNLLKTHADETQGNVRSFLEGHKTEPSIQIYQSWMTNELILKNIGKETIAFLAEMDDIKEIRADRRIPWDQLRSPTFASGSTLGNSYQWGIKAIQAPEVWAMGIRGEGVVVASIDSGVRGTHEALRQNHRRENGWLDPIDGDVSPTDNYGHGTHTMGTIAGQTNGIGVAPEAKWISCKACDPKACELSGFIICGIFMGCPTDVHGLNAKCELAPHLVSNSWGWGQGNPFYKEVIATWILADIAPIFSAGNNGISGCNTVISPADYSDVIAVGATNSSYRISVFSSRGPTHPDRRMKPDISAPGVGVVSAHNRNDTAYLSLQGTSMACPHVAGVAALLYAENPNLSYNEMKISLISGAVPTIPNEEACGGLPDHKFPNNHAGAGLANALTSINHVKQK